MRGPRRPPYTHPVRVEIVYSKSLLSLRSHGVGVIGTFGDERLPEPVPPPTGVRPSGCAVALEAEGTLSVKGLDESGDEGVDSGGLGDRNPGPGFPGERGSPERG